MKEKFSTSAFLEKINENQILICISEAIYRWNGNNWQAVTDKHGEAYVLSWMQEYEPEHISHTVIRQAWKTLKLDLLNAEKQINRTHVVIPCKGTYVNVSEYGEVSLSKPDKELYCTYAIGCEYEPQSVPELFINFLETILPNKETRERVQEYVGYTLMNDCRYHRASLWLGSGANGKGVLSSIVQALHKDVKAIQLDNASRFALSGLTGASLLVADELPNRKLDEAKLKSVIAGEPVYIDIKGHSPITTRLPGKMLVLGNCYPIVDDASEGFWRRWDIVPFKVTIPREKRDARLAATIIENELSGVLNWALEGLQRLLVRKDFSAEQPYELQQAMQTARMVADDVTGWLAARVDNVAGPVSSKKARIYEDYRRWCLANDFSAKTSQGFWLKLKRSRTDLVTKKVRLPGNGGTQNACSIVLKNGADEDAANSATFVDAA